MVKSARRTGIGQDLLSLFRPCQRKLFEGYVLASLGILRFPDGAISTIAELTDQYETTEVHNIPS